MNTLLRTTVFFIGIAFVLLNFYLLYKKKVSERSTILWLLGMIVVVLLTIWPQSLNRLAVWVGVSYPPALLFLVAILILFSIVMYQSMQISILDQKLREMGRFVAILEWRSGLNRSVEHQQDTMEANRPIQLGHFGN